jgi:hypothetical protein
MSAKIIQRMELAFLSIFFQSGDNISSSYYVVNHSKVTVVIAEAMHAMKGRPSGTSKI